MRCLPLLGALLLAGCAAAPPTDAPPAIPAGEDPLHWQGDVAAFLLDPPSEPHPVVFVGSSSIRLWSTLVEDMAPVPVVNRGFGGSRIFDAVYWAGPLVADLEPAVVVVFSGTNDLAGDAPREPGWVAARFDELVLRLRALGCDAPLVYIAISPTPARERHLELVLETNRLIEARCHEDPRLYFVDTASALLDEAGHCDPRYFAEDRLHLRAEGYASWTHRLKPLVRTLYDAERR